MFIRSERLFLRPPWPEDWRDLLAALSDTAIIDEHREQARCFTAAPQDRRTPHFLITLPGAEGPRLIGACGLDRKNDAVEMGLWIARDHRGRGYAAEACRALLGLARALGHARVIACASDDDSPAVGLLVRLGFAPTCQVRSTGESDGRVFAIDLEVAGEDTGGGPMPRAA